MSRSYQKFSLFALDVIYLQEALRRCITQEDLLAKTFYESLFEEHPITKRLFGSEPDKQRRMFATLLESAAAEMMNPNSLEPLLASVGNHHRKHHLTNEHLEMGRIPFFKAVTKCIGETEFSEQFTTWNSLYSMLVDLMQGGSISDDPVILKPEIYQQKSGPDSD